jgi:hypothetical protein
MMLGRRSRVAAALSGAALLAGGFYERLGLLRAGIASTRDPKYVVQPQRERLDQRRRQESAAADAAASAEVAGSGPDTDGGGAPVRAREA